MYIFLLLIGMLAAVIGIGLMFDVLNRDPAHRGKVKAKEVPSEDEPVPAQTERRSLSKTVDQIQGKRDFYLVEEANNARAILNETGRAGEWARTMTLCAVGAGIGALLGIICDRNIALIIIFGAGGFMFPLWRLKFYRNKYHKYLNSQLESCTSLITTSYIRGDDIYSAVRENLDDLSPVIKPYFQDFLTESMVNASTKGCIRNLQDKINNGIFKEWCETLLRTVDNSEMRESLLPIVQKFSDVRVVQEEIDIETRQAIIEYVIMMAMDVLCYPLVWVLNKEWYAYYHTFGGKCVIAFTFIVLLYAIVKLIDVMQPVEYKR